MDVTWFHFTETSFFQSSIEGTAVIFGLWSVWLAKKNKVGLYPTGLVNTLLYVYLLAQWQLWGDMLINAYYVVMGIYGWVHWSKNKSADVELPITRMNAADVKKSVELALFALAFVLAVYYIFNTFTHWIAALDTGVTVLFFVGMWLMTQRKIENWLFWIAGDLISVPMYWYKGYPMTAIQYLLFTIIALYGYKAWKTAYYNNLAR
jgi:nicotinamide mononucleotide transporter